MLWKENCDSWFPPAGSGKGGIVTQTNRLRPRRETNLILNRLLCGNEFQANRRRNGKRVTCWRKFAAERVHVENNDCVAQLIFDEHEIACRIERKMPRLFSTSGNAATRRERSFFGINGKERDAVHAAVGNVQISSVGMNGDFGDIVAAREFRWQ